MEFGEAPVEANLGMVTKNSFPKEFFFEAKSWALVMLYISDGIIGVCRCKCELKMHNYF